MPAEYAIPSSPPAAPSGLLRSEGFNRCLLIAASVLFSWGLIEIPALLNVIDYQGLEYSQVWGSLRFIRVPDPQLLHLEPPYAHYKGSSRGGDFETRYRVPPADQTQFHWDLKYDHNGFRNNSDLKTADIVAIGDSMTEGMTVPEGDVVTSILGRLQGKTVANLGQYGYGPQQELVVLKRYGLPLRPKTVLWMFFEGNDLTDDNEYRKLQSSPKGFWNFFLERSFTRFAFRAIRRLISPNKPDGAARSGIITLSDGRTENIYFSYPGSPLGQDDNLAIGDVTRIIASAQSLAGGQGARLIFVFVPDKFRVLHDFIRFPETSAGRRWIVNDLPARMRNALAAAVPEAGFVDITGDLAQEAKQGKLPFYRDDIHFSETGHAVAARAIDAYMTSSGKR